MTDEELLHRSTVIVRAVSKDQDETMTFTGLAVPWNEPVDIWDWDGTYTEEIARGAVRTDLENPKILWQHRTGEPIGRVVDSQDTEDGYEITAKLSDTERGREAYTLLKDGVIDRLSIGFVPIVTETHEDENGAVRKLRTEIHVKEVSLVTWPAYDSAKVETVRSHTPNPPHGTEVEPMEIENTNTELREELDDLKRSVSLVQTTLDRNTPPAPSRFRTAGEILKALVSGDDEAREEYNETIKRAFTGSTTADSVDRPAWVGDLTRIVENIGPLGNLFSTGVLPEHGMSLEYAELIEDTHNVDEQVNEGDDLSFGEIKIGPGTAPVKTYGGYTELSHQLIKRSSVNYLDASLRAMAISAGRRREATLRALFESVVTSSANGLGNGGLSSVDSVIRTWIKAQEHFQDQGLGITALVADSMVFEQLATLTNQSGESLLTFNGKGFGTLDLTALTAEVASLTVVLDSKLTEGTSAFVNAAAIRAYNSPLATLQAENIVNLTKQYSVFYQSALATEIPGAIAPLE